MVVPANMFGLAIWDNRTRRLLPARDRSGEKPLFYADLVSELVFGSEPKAILAYPAVDRALDPIAATTFFALGYVLSPLLIDLWRKGEFPFDRLLGRTYAHADIAQAIAAMECGEVIKPVVLYS